MCSDMSPCAGTGRKQEQQKMWPQKMRQQKKRRQKMRRKQENACTEKLREKMCCASA